MKKNNIGTIFFMKLLISIIITLIILIIIKSSNNFKNDFYKHIYGNNISFTYIKALYNKYIGDSDILDKVVKTETVFNEKLTYKKENSYKDGVALTVDNNYMIPTLESGVIVFIGEKEEYGKTIIIEQINGIEVFYANIEPINLKLYDYIEKGSLLGEAKNNKLYLVFSKDGKYLNYKDYI